MIEGLNFVFELLRTEDFESSSEKRKKTCFVKTTKRVFDNLIAIK